MLDTIVRDVRHALRMFSQSPSRTSGSDCRAISQLKNEPLTRSQPGEPVTAKTSSTPTTAVEAAASSTDRIALPRR